MSGNIVDRYYDQSGCNYRMSSTRRERVLGLLDSAIERSAGAGLRLLDIGIGSGEIPRHCRENTNSKNLIIEGIDITETSIKKHERLYDSVRVLNVEDDEWTHSFSDQFDVVVASELVEHLFRPDIFLKTLSEIIVPRGYIVLSTPNMLLWSQRIKFMLGRHAYAETGVFEWGHIHLFSWRFLKAQIEVNNFSIVETNHLLHPNMLNPLHKILPAGLFAFQFIILAQKR